MKTLSKKQLFAYGIAGIGPNMLNLMVGSYLCDALMTSGFFANIEHWTYLNKTLIAAGLWSIFVTIAKIIDGVADVPLGAWTDRLRSKFGRRRPAMLLGIVLMSLAYFMFLIVPFDVVGKVVDPAETNQVLNTIWFFVWLAVFYTFYTLTMVTYYATFSEVTENEPDRVFLSNVKSGVDVIYFCLGYALIPAVIGLANIRVIAVIVYTLMISMLIPFILLKEESTLNKDLSGATDNEENPPMLKSLAYSFKNKDFIIWMIVYCALQFGLQMFLTGFNVYYSGTMGFSGMQIMLCNIAGFAPVPFTLILYNKINKKKGFKFGFQYALLIFALGMLMGVFVRPQYFPDDLWFKIPVYKDGEFTGYYPLARLLMAMTANTICSFGIGSFFSVSYTMPSQIAAKEKAEKGISNPAMYFAVQGLFGALASALSTGIVWIGLKKYSGGNAFLDLLSSEYYELDPDASLAAGHAVYNHIINGSGWLFAIVALSCVVAFALTFILPKSLSNVGKEVKEVK